MVAHPRYAVVVREGVPTEASCNPNPNPNPNPNLILTVTLISLIVCHI